MRRTLRCYAEGRDGDWEAFCLDLDIAVQGDSFDEVRHALSESITLYLESVMALPEKDRPHLLDRPAPLALRLKFFIHALSSLFKKNDGDGYHHHFTMPCSA